MSRLVWDVGRADPRGSERLGEREGGVKVELKPRAGRTEGLGIPSSTTEPTLSVKKPHAGTRRKWYQIAFRTTT